MQRRLFRRISLEGQVIFQLARRRRSPRAPVSSTGGRSLRARRRARARGGVMGSASSARHCTNALSTFASPFRSTTLAGADMLPNAHARRDVQRLLSLIHCAAAAHRGRVLWACRATDGGDARSPHRHTARRPRGPWPSGASGVRPQGIAHLQPAPLARMRDGRPQPFSLMRTLPPSSYSRAPRVPSATMDHVRVVAPLASKTPLRCAPRPCFSLFA